MMTEQTKMTTTCQSLTPETQARIIWIREKTIRMTTRFIYEVFLSESVFLDMRPRDDEINERVDRPRVKEHTADIMAEARANNTIKPTEPVSL